MQLPDRRWTMVIDMDRCTGCSACVVACHAENNVPIASGNEVRHARAMHWLRVERYWSDAEGQPRAILLPIMCQQCLRAPCEPVCPVYASYHLDHHNINGQAYQRCVGTRDCQANDPYHVRFFNFFDPVIEEPLRNQLNPDVTVRSAGVMEKCTFCLQRLNRAEHDAQVEGQPLREVEAVPACVQTCPPGALMFGDRNDPNSQINKVIAGNRGRSFFLLEELGTQPLVVYLKGGESHGGQ